MKKFLIALIVILSLVVAGEVGFLVYRETMADPALPTTVPTTEATVPQTAAPTELATEVPTEAPTEVPTEVPTEAPTEMPTAVPTEAPTEVPTEVPTEAPTEPEEDDGLTAYLLSFAGNCTLGSTLSDAKNSASFISTVGDNYAYPFENVLSVFGNDDFSMVNLEGVLADSGNPIAKTYTFRGPSAYAKILTEGSIEAVSLANDHTGDFGTQGYKDTKSALDSESISYVEANSALLYETDRGLKVGVYAVKFDLDNWDMQQEIKKLKNNGAQIIVVYFHWGDEKAYEPGTRQINAAHAAVDAGADIVIGTHPHVLQKIENYKDSIICYSLGNFSYGGAKWPSDPDSVIIQVEVIQDPDGNVFINDTYIIPCNMSSEPHQNNFQPTLLSAGNWQHTQILRKLSDTSSDSAGSTESTTGTTPGTEAPSEAPTEVPTEAPAETTAPTTPDVPDIDDPQP